MDSKFFIIAIVFSSLIVASIFFMAPLVKNSPDSFNYEAQIFSVDNFFDEALGDYSGEQISKTKFLYEVVSIEENIITMRNLFDVRAVTGQEIFSVERFYGIDKKTGEHVQGYGDKDRTGYLFAPNNLKPGDNYTYWHINYDSPAEMKFREVLTIEGMEVFLYESTYHADQTLDLQHLPGVPEERGINLDINLKQWIEPKTGRMVKYEDKTIAYYYNIETGERLNPWNKFENSYLDSSIKDQVNLIQREKFYVLFFEIILPLVLFCIALVLFFLHRRDLKNG